MRNVAVHRVHEKFVDVTDVTVAGIDAGTAADGELTWWNTFMLGSYDFLLRNGVGLQHRTKSIIIACKPYLWKDKFPRTNVSSPEFINTIKDKWGQELDLKF